MELTYWFRKSSSTKPNFGSLLAVLHIDSNQSVPFSTHIQLYKNEFDKQTKSFSGKSAANNNRTLLNFERRIESIVLSLDNSKAIDPNEVVRIHRNELKNANQQSLSFVELIQLFDTKKVKSKYKRNLLGFLEKKMSKVKAVDFSDVPMNLYKEFLTNEGYEKSYIRKTLQYPKQVLKWGVGTGVIAVNPLENYILEFVKPKPPVSLTLEEIDRMENVKMTQPLRHAADAFLFCCYTGLSFVEYEKLTNDWIEIDQDKRAWIRIDRQKSEEPQTIPIGQKALKLIEKYGTVNDLPRMTNQKVNEYLKDVARKIKTPKLLTFHLSRKTFCQTLLDVHGTNEIVIASLMGWTSTNQLKRYLRVSKVSILKSFKGN